MSLRFLSLQSFRNYQKLDLPVHTGITVFTGQNGIGKTTILEAVSLLGCGKSFRVCKNIDLIKKNNNLSIVTSDIHANGLDTQIKIKIFPQGKKIFLNDKLAKTTQSLFNLLPVIIFSPTDHKIIDGDSSDRKNFLNRAAANLDWQYAEILNHYNKALLQRNRILKDSFHQSWSSVQLEDVLSAWNEQLCTYGAKLIHKRNEYLTALNPFSKNEYKKISKKEDDFALFYEPLGLENTQIEQDESWIRNFLVTQLKDSMRRDIAMQSTQVGPHKDEILLTLNGNKVKFYGSQGEKKTCALALRLGELALFREKLRKLPILLFDDVSSELDQSRRHSLVELLRKENTQVLITATELPSMLMGEVGKSFQHLDLADFGERN